MAAKYNYLAVAAIDFGTTYSGYAFSFNTEPEKIICNKNWGQSLGFKVKGTRQAVFILRSSIVTDVYY